MAEKNLQEALLEETIINREIAEDTQGEISDLAGYFRDYFKDLRNDRLRQMEKDREGNRTGGMGGLKDLNDSLEKATNIQKGVGGIIGLILGIGPFIKAFVIGAVEGIKDTFRFLSIAFRFDTLSKLPGVKQVISAGKGIGDTFRRMSFNFSRGFDLIGKEATAFGKTSTLAVKDFSTFAGKFGAFAGKVGAFFSSIADIPKKFMPAVEEGREIGRSLSASIKPIIGSIKEVARLGGFIINPFLSMAKIGSGVTKEVGKLGSSVKMIGKIAADVVATFSRFFGGFGRFLFGPIGFIIITIIDAFRGARDSLKKFGDKVKGNLLGLFGIGLLGAVQGVIGGILSFVDLIKNLLLAIPLMIIDLFPGGEKITKAIREFSFADWWKSITDRVIQALLDLGGFIGRKLAEFFTKKFRGADDNPSTNKAIDLDGDGTITPEEVERYKRLNPSRATATAQMEQATTDAKAAADTGGGVTAVDASQVDNSTTNSATVSVANPAPAYNPYDRKTSFSFNG